jgi:MFS-type transporter involved in bile tolerance (Atg22 family)
MYAWIWRRLPGPLPVRALLALALALAVVALLFTVVFPEVDARLRLNEVTVEQ